MMREVSDERLKLPLEIDDVWDPVPWYVTKLFDELQPARYAEIQITHRLAVLRSQQKFLEAVKELLTELH